MDVRPMFLFYKDLRHSYMIAKQLGANHVTCIYSTCYSCQLLQLRFLGLISISLIGKFTCDQVEFVSHIAEGAHQHGIKMRSSAFFNDSLGLVVRKGLLVGTF